MVKTIPTHRMLTPSEVADRFGVDPKTVSRWAKSGKLHTVRTLGGHRRYDSAQVDALLSGSEEGTQSL